MKYYSDMTLLPDAEASLGFIWQKVFTQIHIALVENKTADGHSAVAVSFPKYGYSGFPLGDQLRLLAETESQLEALAIDQWLKQLLDYTHIKLTRPVPDSVQQYACFNRKQVKSNIEKVAQRRSQHLGKPYAEVLEYLIKQQQAEGGDKYRSKLPYIRIESLSTKNRQRFPLFIERDLMDAPQAGKFNCYGLSKTATAPWF
ncbi:MAG: type I-F CRISPR-associated endoribonuclease Cas6/Csy4 [Gammaproteobacteria bacterium]|nr:type I-F CRISPR-associated endoribonuclease Cas6/Csy4 [Gammaproteobacteria bacterium]